MNAELIASTNTVLRDYVLSTDSTHLVASLERLQPFDEKEGLIKTLRLILSEINQWNIEKVQVLSEQLSQEIKEEKLQTMLIIFTKQVILQLLDKIMEKSEKIDDRIQVLLHRNQVLDDAFQNATQLRDEILINKYFEAYLDNLTILGLYALYSADYKNVFQYLGRALEILKGKALHPSKHAFIARTLSNIFLKSRNFPALLKLGRDCLKIRGDSYQISFRYLKRAYTLDKAANYKPGLALDHYFLALLYFERNLIEQGVTEVKKARALHEELDDREGLLNDIILSGIIISRKEKIDEAYEIYNNALSIAMDLDIKPKIGELNLLIGNYLRTHQKYEEGLKHLKTALLIFKQAGGGTETDYIETYHGIGAILRDMHKLDDAKGFLLKILSIEQSKTEFPAVLMELYSQLAITFIDLNKEEEFQHHYNQILTIYPTVKDDFQYANSEYLIGMTFCEKEHFSEGLEHLFKAFKVFYNVRNTTVIEKILQTLSSVYSKLNASELAQKLTDYSKDIMVRSQYVIEQGTTPKPIPPEPSLEKLAPPPMPKAPAPPRLPIAEVISPSEMPQSIPIQRKASPREPQNISPPHRSTPPKSAPPKESIFVPEIPPPPAAPKIKAMSKLSNLIKDMEAEIKAPPPEVTPLKSKPTPASERSCPECGFKIEDLAFQFCPRCAATLEKESPERSCKKCGFKIENPEFKFCPKCATALK
jgi:tetratricopeptide (TPR) repeat protein